MSTGPTEKKALVFSDNENLSRAIEISLDILLDVEIINLTPSSLEALKSSNGNVDLIVMAMSSLNSEPVVTLARTLLTRRVGQVPLLIISDRPFDSVPEVRIFHLDFPFGVDGLRDKVQEILQSV
jgi:hypothetical protein